MIMFLPDSAKVSLFYIKTRLYNDTTVSIGEAVIINDEKMKIVKKSRIGNSKEFCALAILKKL